MTSIRDEDPEEGEAIAALVQTVFREAAHADGTEHALPARLRQAGDLAVSLIAEEDGVLVGHMAFSPVTITDGSSQWYGLGPLSVLPHLHAQGIGSALVREGLARLRE